MVEVKSAVWQTLAVLYVSLASSGAIGRLPISGGLYWVWPPTGCRTTVPSVPLNVTPLPP
jgi:hypothetical protein